MKVLILSDVNVIHTIRWAVSLHESGLEIAVLSLSSLKKENENYYDGVEVYHVGDLVAKGEGGLAKITYLKLVPLIKKSIIKFRPDILHAHYASSYGLLGALSGFSPFLISVWGNDIFSFPYKSPLHRAIIKYNLKKADLILSTSQIMAQQTMRFTNKPVTVVPFGVDLERFKPIKVETPFSPGDIVIGTVKTMEPKYGIKYLVEAFSLLKTRRPELPLKLLIVGGGSRIDELIDQVSELGFADHVKFTGSVGHDEVPRYFNMLDIAVFLSTLDSESFGVAIIEASACEKPVVVSDVGGLPEVVEDGVTGTVVAKKNAMAAANAIEKLIDDEELRSSMGQKGRERVKRHYDWSHNVRQMIDIYQDVLSR